MRTKTTFRPSIQTKLAGLLLMIFNLMYSGYAHGQITQRVRGQVVDAATKSPLSDATVTVYSGDVEAGGITDENGNFQIDGIPVGRIGIIIQMVGYEDRMLSQLELRSAKELVLDVEMQESFVKFDAVVISRKKSREKPSNEMATVSARSFSVEETSRYAAAAFDPARMAQNFAGVTSGGDDLFNEIVVRGNSPKGVLWRLEGIEIANPNHFASGGGQGGAISMLSSSTLGSSDFYTGAFPAEYGNALSGVFDLKLRKGNNEKRENSFMIGALGLELATEGPFSKNYDGSYLINYRYSTLGFLQAIGLSPTGDLLPTYQDLSYNLYFPTKKMGKFNVFGVMGQNVAEMFDDFDVNDTSEDARWEYDGFSEVGFVNTTGIKHVLPVKDKGYIKTVLSHSFNRYTQYYETLEIDSTTNTVFQFQEDEIKNDETQMRLSSMLNYKFNRRNTFRTGIVVSRLDYNFVSKFYDYEDNSEFIAFDDKNSSMQYQAYAQWKHRLSSNLTANIGTHFTRLEATKSNSFEPRASLTYKHSSKLSLSASAGKHSRPEHLALYLYKDIQEDGSFTRPNENLKLTKAWHYVLAADYKLSKNMRLKTEVYYQSLFDVPISTVDGSTVSVLNTSNYWDAIFNGDTTHMQSAGKGRNVGVDITLERFFQNDFYYMTTATLFNSSYQTQTGKWYSTKYNGRYQFNVLGGKEFTLGKKNRKFGINGKVNVFGGNRFTPILLAESIQEERTVRDTDNPYGDQTPVYYRFDIGLSYKVNTDKATHTVLLDVQNFTGRQNIGGMYYDSKAQKIEGWTMTGLFPFFNYRIEF
ncbi:MAG: TonB-dependent receptor [Bacteroidia bacterium]|nr:TonB-dependent receptor [Bacteroidia bacterium]